MKKFLARLAIVLVPFAGIMLLLGALSVREEMRLLRADLKCRNEERAVVVGDSRVEVHFDPEVNPWLKNCGQSATPFIITAKKARMVVEENPNLELLVIDIWPGRFFSSTEVPFGVSEPAAPKCIALLELVDRADMPPIIDDGYEIRFVRGVLFPGLKNLIGFGTGKSGIAGGFRQNKRSLRGSPWEQISAYTNEPPLVLGELPPGGEVLLERLLQWLSERHVNVVLTSTPIYKHWWDYKYTPEVKAYFLRRMTEISQKYGVPWYNWLQEYWDEIDLWADGDHLNTRGAQRFSKEKASQLKKHLKNLN